MSPRGPARCRKCQAPIVWFRSPFSVHVRKFDPAPVDSHHALAGVTVFPVLDKTAFRPAALVDLLQVQRQCTDREAEAEMQDIPWHQLHDCGDDAPPAAG